MATLLSQQAKDELRTLLEIEIGVDLVNSLSDEEVNQFGSFLLRLRAEIIKINN